METKRRFTTFPYDLAIHYFRTSTNDMASALRHRFSFTSNIVNFSTASYSSLNLDDDTYLVHGKSVAREHGV